MITGSRGFIGSYLTQYLKEAGHRVFECNRDTLNLLDRAAVSKFFEQNYFDVVIHTALVGRENLYELKETLHDPLIKENLAMWDNLVVNRHRFKRLINFGSGNEMDTDLDITLAEEKIIFDREPKYTYGWVKNFISRDLVQYENFHTLRLFGVFHYTENSKRFFKKIYKHSRQDFHIFQDRFFDFINLEDVAPMVDIIVNGQCKHNDINVVYKDKYKLSEMAAQFNDITASQTNIIVDNANGPNYTGDYERFYSYNTPKFGLHLGFLRY